eukprot:GFYU01005393.1.p1 GENE.GFYU01005393.1~~GFYU01005393.1.p1  ORF type:complete len:441 (-),score=68.14 GFYU01005393.1:72-1394(-)
MASWLRWRSPKFEAEEKAFREAVATETKNLIVALSQLSANEIDSCRTIFEFLADGDSRISNHNLVYGTRAAGYNPTRTDIDDFLEVTGAVEEDNSLSFREFMYFVSRVKMNQSRDKYKQAFTMGSSDGSTCTADGLARFMKLDVAGTENLRRMLGRNPMSYEEFISKMTSYSREIKRDPERWLPDLTEPTVTCDELEELGLDRFSTTQEMLRPWLDSDYVEVVAFRERKRLQRLRRGKKVIIIGGQASGKGTQCALLVDYYGMVHISTGDILRTEVDQGTKLGQEALAFMSKGLLVPDPLVVRLVNDRLKQPDCQANGWILDGFPRTQTQAEALQEVGIVPDAVIMLNVPAGVLEDRVLGKRIDPVTGEVYNMKTNPPPEHIQDRLVQSPDDTVEKVRKRIEAYQANAKNLKQFYGHSATGINGGAPKEQVFRHILELIP